MFTGIIEEIGSIVNISKSQVTISAQKVLEDTKAGDSISVNGVCLTVTRISDSGFTADMSEETYSVTMLKSLKTGDSVNLERAMPANGRFGGHIVLGHVDGIGKISDIVKRRECYDILIELDYEDSKYVVKKGSIAVNGISLTAADVFDNSVKIAVIPHTFQNTSLKTAKKGDLVNIETDITAKYIEKFLSTRNNSSGIDMEFLIKNGF